MGRIIEGTWDCSSCGNKKILARYKNCTSCGASQGKDTTFKMPDKITYLSKEEASNISKQPDWLCSYCEQLNKSTDANCKGCGATKEDSEKNYFQMKAAREKKQEEIRKQEIEFEKNAYQKELNKIEKNLNKKPSWFSNLSKKNLLLGSSIILGLVLSILGLVYLFTPKEDTINVTELSWNRTISIEKEKTVEESDWTVPNGGRVYDSRREIHHYEDVLDHYENVEVEKSRQVLDHYEEMVTGYNDLGNGYFEEITFSQPVYRTEYYTETESRPVYRQEPVYQTKYYYEIDKWFFERKVETSGINDEPFWGEVILASKERESGRQENYKMKAINSKNKEKEYSLDFENWSDIKIGDNLKVKVDIFGEIEIIE